MAPRWQRDATDCTCPLRPAPVKRESHGYTWTDHPNRCGGECCEDSRAKHHFGCPLWGPQGDVYVSGVTKPTKSLLGSKRTPYEAWAKKVSLYAWPLWRNWTKPKPIKVETAREILERQIGKKARRAFIASVLAIKVNIPTEMQQERYEKAPRWKGEA